MHLYDVYSGWFFESRSLFGGFSLFGGLLFGGFTVPKFGVIRRGLFLKAHPENRQSAVWEDAPFLMFLLFLMTKRKEMSVNSF